MHQVTEQERERLFLGFMGSLTAGISLWWLQGRFQYATFPIGAFIQPEIQAVQDLALSFPATTEDEFILSAWQFVGEEIEYEPIGSDLTFIDSHVRCLKCYLPTETLKRGKGNCVAASALLTSLLAVRLPPERVGIAIGQLALDGVGGHAWSIANREGVWYVVEATRPPGSQPWLAAAQAPYYQAQVIVTGTTFACADEKLCLRISKCNCPQLLDKLL